MKIPKGVYSTVSGEEPSGWLPNEAELIQQNQEAFDKALQEVVEAALNLMTEKAKEYDFGAIWWDHQPFGDLSWVSGISEIVGRLESVLRGSHPNKLSIVEDKSQDLVIYGLAWLAWRKIKLAQLIARRQVVRSDAEKALDDFVTSVAVEGAQQIDREIMGESEPDPMDLVSAEAAAEIRRKLTEPYVPPRPEPTTGPAPKEGLVKRLRKLGRKTG